ncbi:MAG: anti-sigma factor family protein [Jiangellaceae bacterium]
MSGDSTSEERAGQGAPRSESTGCDEVRLSLGALVLAALDPDEERRVRAHLATCPECSAELEALSRTAGLLTVVAPDGVDDAPSSRVLDGLLHEVAATRRRDRRRRVALGFAAAASAAVIGVAGTAAVLDGGDDSPPADAAGPADDVAEPADHWAHGANGGVVLDVGMWERGWGTAVHVEVSGVAGGSRCSLVAVGRDGTREVAATWTVPGNGYTPDAGPLAVDGAVGMQAGEVSRYEVVTADGDVLVATSAR